MGLTQVQGKRGEDLAADFLRTKGYTLIARNVRSPFGEIDLICRDGKTTVFVEVKYRTAPNFGHPEEAIPGNKLERLEKSVEWYVTKNKLAGDYRLDVVSIEGESPQVVHLQDVS